ncbi:MAG: glycosyltransferase family 9 protein [Candidatus Cloacimonetes bacterium]|nr:glycosyltransferase family 9 protein [Candidatus Cloacimonadota bacterium]
MERILILNLTRMGDLVQMLGLVGGLRRRWPQARIDVLAMKAFAGILERFPHIDNVLTLDDTRLVGTLGEDMWSGYRELKQSVDALNATDYDYVVSPVVSIQAAWIGFMLDVKRRSGMFFNADRQQTITSEWTAFHLANEHHLGDRTFNLVDIFARVGGVGAKPEDFRLEPGEEAEAKAAETWREHGLDGRQVVGVHCGASQSNKAWEPERFRAVIEKLLLHPQRSVVLFGGYNELALTPYFESLRHPNFVNLIGRSGLADLVAMLARLDLLIANDTGPMHLAASMDTPILNISLGPVSMWETGPYLPGAVVIQADIPCHPCAFDRVCSHLDCHKLITVEAVSATAESMLAGHTPEAAPGALTWRARIDPFGLLHCVPVRKRPIEARDLFFECKRAVWAMTLLPGLDEKIDWVKVFTEDLAQHYDTGGLDMSAWLSMLARLEESAGALTGALQDLARQRPGAKKSIDRIHDKWSRIKQMKEELFALGRDTNDCYDLFLYARFRESSLESDDFTRLTRDTIEIYAGLCLQLQALARLTRSYNASETE